MERLDGVTAIALVVIASFAIDRIVTGSLFLLSYSKAWARRFPEPASLEDEHARTQAEKRQKLIYFALAGFLGMVVLAGVGNVRILSALVVQPKQAESTNQSAQQNSPPQTTQAGSTNQGATTNKTDSTAQTSKAGISLFSILDIIFTGLLLMGGADRIAQVIKMPGAHGGEKAESRPIQLSGKLTIENKQE